MFHVGKCSSNIVHGLVETVLPNWDDPSSDGSLSRHIDGIVARGDSLVMTSSAATRSDVERRWKRASKRWEVTDKQRI